MTHLLQLLLRIFLGTWRRVLGTTILVLLHVLFPEQAKIAWGNVLDVIGYIFARFFAVIVEALGPSAPGLTGIAVALGAIWFVFRKLKQQK
ncbi:MAG: hypothetical protein V4480_03605 [Patescibacteria group bacterium]